jgi:hypothetical protein
MSASVRPPALPLAPLQYDPGFQEQYSRALRLFLEQLVSDGFVGANQLLLDPAFPTEANYANILDNQVFVDTQNGDVLRMKSGNGNQVWPSPYPLIWLNM